jgi:tripartite-type tricarboxylate transporter receptor subunit TctC
MSRKMAAVVLITVIFVGVLAQPSQGKEYPTRPIEILIPYTAGSSLDLMTRIVAEFIEQYLGQRLVPVSKVGAGGAVAAAEVLSSKPDGYKLMVTTNFFFAMTTKTQKVPFNPSHLVPLANFVEFRNGLIVKGSSPWKTFNDLLDYARKNPGKLKWSHTGRGIVQHMYGLMIFRKAGVETVDIPYPGTPDMLSALLGGHTDASFAVYGGAREHVKAGTVRYLLTVSDHRFSVMPDVPSSTELGFPEVGKLQTHVGFYAHKDTPEEIKKTLIEAFKKIQENPEFKKRLEVIGEELKFEGPEFMRESIKKSEEPAMRVLKEFGLYVGDK